jgi:hypothetical protein
MAMDATVMVFASSRTTNVLPFASARMNMSMKRISISIMALCMACAPVRDDELDTLGGEGVEEAAETDDIGEAQQAVTFDPSCAQWQRDVIANANFGVWLVSSVLLNSWSAPDNRNRRVRWWGTPALSTADNTLFTRVQALRNISAAGGPSFFCSANACPSNVAAFSILPALLEFPGHHRRQRQSA